MDLLRMFQVLGRRWFIAVPVILIGSYLTHMVAKDMPPQYKTAGSLIVVDAASGPGSIEPAVIARLVQDAEISDRVMAEQGQGSYRVEVEKGNLVITASSTLKSTPPKIANAVLEEIKNVIVKRREAAGAPVKNAEEAGFEQLNRAGSSSTWNQGRKLYEATASARMQAGTEDAIGMTAAKTTVYNELDGSRVRNAIARDGGLDDYKIEQVQNTTTITFMIANSDKDKVKKTAELLVKAAPEELTRLQKATGRSQTNLTINRLGGASEPVQDNKGIIRSVIGLIAVTLVAAVLLSFIAESIAEGIASRRRRQRFAPRSSERPRHEGPRPVRPVGGSSREAVSTSTAPVQTVSKRSAPAESGPAQPKRLQPNVPKSPTSSRTESAGQTSGRKPPVASRPSPRSSSSDGQRGAVVSPTPPAASPNSGGSPAAGAGQGVRPTAPQRPTAAPSRSQTPTPITPPNGKTPQEPVRPAAAPSRSDQINLTDAEHSSRTS